MAKAVKKWFLFCFSVNPTNCIDRPSIAIANLACTILLAYKYPVNLTR